MYFRDVTWVMTKCHVYDDGYLPVLDVMLPEVELRGVDELRNLLRAFNSSDAGNSANLVVDDTDVRVSEARCADNGRASEPRDAFDGRGSELRVPDARTSVLRAPDGRPSVLRVTDGRGSLLRVPDGRTSVLRVA